MIRLRSTLSHFSPIDSEIFCFFPHKVILLCHVMYNHPKGRTAKINLSISYCTNLNLLLTTTAQWQKPHLDYSLVYSAVVHSKELQLLSRKAFIYPFYISELPRIYPKTVSLPVFRPFISPCTEERDNTA